MDRIKYYLPVVMVAIAAIALVPMASGISNLSMRPGTLLEESTIRELRALLTASGNAWNLFTILILLLPVLILAVYFYQPSKKRAKHARKNSSLGTIIQLLLWLVALILLRRRLKLEKLNLDFVNNAAQSLSEIDFTAKDVPVTSLPAWITFVISFFLIGFLFFLLWRYRRPTERLPVLSELISKQADTTIEELNLGIEFREVITKCYYEMNKVLRDQRGIKRKQHFTPREFENRLIDMGFPSDSVTELTRLFEMVRYGQIEPDEGQKTRAVDCLVVISNAGENKL